jgi:uncharacterized membrane protein YfcA
MGDVFFYGGLGLTGFAAGLLGALLGLGGGVFIVPALVLLFGMPPITAVGTSNTAVIATSTAGASQYVKNRLANIRLALLLLISTTIAALVASLVAGLLPAQWLSGLFSVVLIYVAVTMFRGRRESDVTTGQDAAGESSDSGKRSSMSGLGLGGEYEDANLGRTSSGARTVKYEPRNVRAGMGISTVAGVIAGLLGVGGGIVQMPLMTLLMGVPVKVATGTSNFMVGVTAVGAAFVRYANGDIDPLIAVPVALTVFVGARIGAWLVPRLASSLLRTIFAYVSIVIAAMMLLQAFGIYRIR